MARPGLIPLGSARFGLTTFLSPQLTIGQPLKVIYVLRQYYSMPVLWCAMPYLWRGSSVWLCYASNATIQFQQLWDFSLKRHIHTVNSCFYCCTGYSPLGLFGPRGLCGSSTSPAKERARKQNSEQRDGMMQWFDMLWRVSVARHWYCHALVSSRIDASTVVSGKEAAHTSTAGTSNRSHGVLSSTLSTVNHSRSFFLTKR